jgi:hypothetical protein
VTQSASSPPAPFSPQPAELIPSGLLSASLESDVALIHLKDRSGRYLRINRRLAERLGTSPERLIGQRDDQLPPAETIDGPRVHAGTEVSAEPQTLEYVVEPFGTRPALLVLRFTVLNDQGEVAGTCAVAAARGDAGPARAEGERLLAIAGLLQAPVPGASGHAAAVDPVRDDRDRQDGEHPDAEIRALRSELAQTHAELTQTHAELAQTHAELIETRSELAIARPHPALPAREILPLDTAPAGGESAAIASQAPAPTFPAPTLAGSAAPHGAAAPMRPRWAFARS